MIAPALRRAFAPSHRSHGDTLFATERVRVVDAERELLQLTVEDGQVYEVELTFDGDLVKVVCDCPHSKRGGNCAHAWACLHEADARGFMDGGTDEPDCSIDDEDRAQADEDDRGGDGGADSDEEDEEDAPAEVRDPSSRFGDRRRHWAAVLQELQRHDARAVSPMRQALPDGAVIEYHLDVERSKERGAAILRAVVRTVRKNGTLSQPSPLRLTRDCIVDLPVDEDRQVIESLCGALSGRDYSVSYSQRADVEPSWRMDGQAHFALLRKLALSRRLFVSSVEGLAGPCTWEDEPAWDVVVTAASDRDGWLLRSGLRRGDERVAAADLVLAAPGLAVLPEGRLAPLRPADTSRWLVEERLGGPIRVPRAEGLAAVAALLQRNDAPRMDLPESLTFETVRVTPSATFDMVPDGAKSLAGTLRFDYAGRVVAEGHPAARIVSPRERRVHERDAAFESEARRLLASLGVSRSESRGRGRSSWAVPAARMAGVATALTREGWRVTAQGRAYRAGEPPTIHVVSGIDWFDVQGAIDYGGQSAQLPDILRAARRGETSVLLGDGTLGMLPEEWLARWGRMLAMGETSDEGVRFRPSQAALLDVLLAQQPKASCDETFARLRRRLRTFDGIAPASQPKAFRGVLRDYQLTGVAWMGYLRDFGFGGCLADDMGVGKTAQVLAMLESRRSATRGKDRRPSLVVVPRSLIHNWLAEAARFTPKLCIADLSHSEREITSLAKLDVGLVTYGTLRRDAAVLREIPLEYAILDEAQAIKNPTSASAKAARLLDARHRLVMTGTPVENRLGDLWSLFEFLNPGMLGAASVFRRAKREPTDEDHALLARALRPFLLRRTKQQVAPELPERTEQTIRCELLPSHRRLYDEVRDVYRAQFLGPIAEDGAGRTRMHLFEALLRLRQIACHPGLVDPARRGEESAKLTTLVEQLGQVVEEGHKVLVFSQFTQLLSIVRGRLDAHGIVHEDLDGTTKDRAARVARFQSDPACPVFLISLKAGGVGLNLTAADYVFLLDPWWNPAVEAQAIDRTHRIGQTRPVMAYRIISSGTVEEHVLALQERKRELADAILGDDAGLLGNLSREDIELLLS